MIEPLVLDSEIQEQELEHDRALAVRLQQRAMELKKSQATAYDSSGAVR